MSGVNDATIVLKKLNNMPVIFEEFITGVRLVTSFEAFKDGMYELNKQFASIVCASFNDFLTCFEDTEVVLPDNFDSDYLNAGWCAECMYQYDGPWIDYELEIKEGKEFVVGFRFSPMFCTSYMDCLSTGEDCYEH